ncbi:hypothetical protein PWT90_07457 [Aphanocladium album]|nr:hypothetical protein PWT90_07457 [Aphanocladium album]
MPIPVNISENEEKILREAVAASLLSARPAMPPGTNIGGHRLGTEPIAKNDDGTSNMEVSRLPPYQRTQAMEGNEYTQRHRSEMYKVQFSGVELSQGDTLVFVDFPQPDFLKPPVDCDGIPFRSQQFRVHSKNLLATGSSKFAEMLQPTYQFRIQRRRKLVNALPEGIKYVLDLTPPSEGDEMVFQITELSLTPGIIKWWSSYARLDVPFFLVKGHDDVCRCKEGTNRSLITAQMERAPVAGDSNQEANAPYVVTLPYTVESLVSLRNEGKKLQIEHVPPHFDIPDYCPIRHRNGIIRLLMLIEDREVFIDSAPRLWTLVALAKIWDCVSVVQDPALQWLLQGSNSKFIEILPEEAIRIGGIIQNAQVTRTAFKILVNELAIEQTALDKAKRSIDFNHVTFFGRRKGDPGDEFSNLIQHAALAFVERITNNLAELESDDILESWDIPEYKKLLKIEVALRFEDPKRCETALNMISYLKARMKKILSSVVDNLRHPYHVPTVLDCKRVDSERATYVEPLDFQEFTEIYRMMTPAQKLLTRYPYKELQNSWAEWTVKWSTDITGVNPAYFFQSLGSEMAKLYQLYKDLNAWGDNISPEFYEILSDNWEMPYGCLYPLRHSWIDSQVTHKIEELGARVRNKDQGLYIITTEHLLLDLKDGEIKFLPLWAGGLNDGTGGVFEDQLPPADMGPNGPGPAYHTGMTIPSDASSLSGSFVDDMSAMNMAGSTTAASVDVHDSVSTIYRPNHVIVDDKSIASESFKSDFSDYHEARDKIGEPGEKMVIVAESLDDLLQIADSDSDSAATIGCDDFDTLDDDDDIYT